jgi:hypothetical protein
MANFCNKCGAPSDGGPFCGRCGADMRKTPATAQPQSPAQVVQPVAAVPVQPAVAQPAAFQPVPVQAQAPAAVQAGTVKQGSPLLKIVLVVLALFFVLGVAAIGGVYYVVYRVKQKVQEVKAEVLNGDSSNASTPGSSPSASGTSPAADGCRLLSKEEVGHAIGLEIAATEPNTDGGCAYLAVGTSADFTAKHATSLPGLNGVDAKTKQTVQGIAGGLFNALQSEHPNDKPDKDGKIPVFSFSIDTHSAETQMELNEKVLGNLGPKEAPIEGIGDHAFDAAGSMMMVRKGDKLVRIMYSMCPCGVEAIKPLAKKLADRL